MQISKKKVSSTQFFYIPPPKKKNLMLELPLRAWRKISWGWITHESWMIGKYARGSVLPVGWPQRTAAHFPGAVSPHSTVQYTVGSLDDTSIRMSSGRNIGTLVHWQSFYVGVLAMMSTYYGCEGTDSVWRDRGSIHPRLTVLVALVSYWPLYGNREGGIKWSSPIWGCRAH